MKLKMKQMIVWASSEESGQGLVEYALIIGMISIAAIAIMTILGPKISNTFSNANNKI